MIVVDRHGIYRNTELSGCGRLSCRIAFQHTHADLLSVQFEEPAS